MLHLWQYPDAFNDPLSLFVSLMLVVHVVTSHVGTTANRTATPSDVG